MRTGKRIHLNLSRSDAASLLVILWQALDESVPGDEWQIGMLSPRDQDVADRVLGRLDRMLKGKRVI